MTDQTDDLSQIPSQDDQTLRDELRSIVGADDQSQTPATPEPIGPAPDLYAIPTSPTVEAIEKDGTIGDVSFASQLSKRADEINAEVDKNPYQNSLLGTNIGLLTGADKDSEIAARQAYVDYLEKGVVGPNLRTADKLAADMQGSNLPHLMSPSQIIMGLIDPKTAFESFRQATPIGKGRETQVGIDFAKAHPDVPMETWSRNVGESAVAGVAGNFTGLVDAVGKGAALAGAMFSDSPDVGENTLTALAKYATAKTREMVPGDPVRRADFSTAFAQGLGSTIGFYGANAGGRIIGGLVGMGDPAKQKLAIALTASLGAAVNASQVTEDVQQTAAANNVQLSKYQLGWIFIAALAIGSTEAVPIAENLPLAPSTKNKALLLIHDMAREGLLEEGPQEGLNQIANNLLAKYGIPFLVPGYDPNRDVMDQVATNYAVGALSGGAVSGGRLAVSPGARQEVYREAAKHAAPGAPAPAQGGDPNQQPAPANQNTAPAQGAMAASGRTFNVDLSAFDQTGAGYPGGGEPLAFDPRQEFAGSARPLVPLAEVGDNPVPDINLDIYPIAPRDENGDIDAMALRTIIETATGKNYWNQLSDAEKITVHQALMAEEGMAPAVQPVQAQQPAVGATPTAQGQTATGAQAAAQVAHAAPVATSGGSQAVPQGGAQIAASLPETAAATAVTPQDIEQYAKAASLKPQQAQQTLDALQEYAASRGMTWHLAGGDVVLTDRNGKSFVAPPDTHTMDVAEMATKNGYPYDPGEYLDQTLADAGLDTRPNEAAQADSEGTGNLFSPEENPALQEAQALHQAGVPAQQWPTPAIVAGEQAGLVRLDNQGTPRIAPATDAAEDAAPDQVTDGVRRAFADLAREAAGGLRPARFGETHAHGEPVAIRALVDRLKTLSMETLKAEFSNVARLARMRTHEQTIARVARGLMARELHAKGEGFKLSNAARELVDQSVEDAFAGKPIVETVAKVQADDLVNTIADEAIRVAKHFDKDAVEILKEHGGSVVQEIAAQLPVEEIAAAIEEQGIDLPTAAGGIVEAVQDIVREGAGRLGKRDGVHAPEKTIDEIIAESGAPKDQGPDRLKNYAGVEITGYEGEGADEHDQAFGSVKKGFLDDARSYLTKVSKILSERGFTPHMLPAKGKKGKGKAKLDKAVSVNKSGPAVSGDVSLTMHDADGNGVYVDISQSGMSGANGITLMARRASPDNRYGTKSQNQFLPVNLTIEELANRLERIARPDSAPPIATPESQAPTGAQNPYAFSAQTVLREEGKQALRDRLNGLLWGDLRDMAHADGLIAFSRDDAIRNIIAHAEQQLGANPVPADGGATDVTAVTAGGEEVAAEPQQATSVEEPALAPHTDDLKTARDPDAVIDALIAEYGKPVSGRARKYAITLDKIGTDAGLFSDLIAKMSKDKALKKADLDAINWLYGNRVSAKSKALAIEAIERHFRSLSEAEADAAVLAGEPAIITRDEEAHADDRRRSERDNRLHEGERALSEGGISESLGSDEKGGDAGGASQGDGGGSGAVREHADVSDAGAGAKPAVSGKGEGAQSDSRDGKRTGDARRNLRATNELREAVAQADKERKARKLENYRITAEDEIGQGGPKAKVRANIAAIKLVKELQETPDRLATPEEKKVLVKYVGWGAFAQDVFAEHKPEWAAERQQLTDLLSAEEYAAARRSTLNAHYTSQDVINGMWGALGHLGFNGGKALEPSAGVGHFIGLAPDQLTQSTDWTAVELDKITGAIAKYLYPGADVRVQGFETINFPDNYFDLAISNVPFGDYKLTDRKYPSLLIHDYFFAKSLDKVRPGGVVAFITSSGTMDKMNTSARRLIADKADLIGAIRLPGGSKGAFAGNAGTDVTTDILFLRKRASADDAMPDAPKWIETTEIETPDGPTKINEYFAAHPDMMLGEMRLQGTMYRDKSPVLVGSSENLGARIAMAAALHMPGNIITDRATTTENIDQAPELADPSTKEGAFFLKNGKLFQNVAGAAVPQTATGKVLKRYRGLMDMRDLVNDLLNGQRTGDTASGGHLRAKLNKAYDAFVKEFGPIGKVVTTVSKRKIKGQEKEIITRRLPNLLGFDDDPDAGKVMAIENYNEETGTATKAAIFTTDIVQPYARPTINTPVDAMAVSLNETGKIDMQRIADMLNMSEDEAADALGDRVYLDPNGELYQTSEIYLSGDVVTKLEQAREAAKSNPLYSRNVAALEAVQPVPLTSVDIRTNLGAPWIPVEVYNEFIAKVIGVEARVKFEKLSSTWTWAGGKPYSPPSANAQWASTDEHGTVRVSADELLIAAMNSKAIKVFDKHKDGQTLNKVATEQAAIKIKAMAEAFTGDPNAGLTGWVFEDPARTDMLEALYNAKYNRLVRTQFDGSHLDLPGIAKSIAVGNGKTVPFELRPHQKNVVWRAIQSGNVLMDHCVGAGKTFAMIAAAMEQKRLGLIQRPMFVVPNHMLEQFSREFLQAYPNAKILVAQKKYMEAKNRKAFAARIAADNWDAIIIKHSDFGRLPMRKEAYEEYLNAQMREVLDAWLEAKKNAGERATEADFEDVGQKGASGKKRGGSRDPSVKQIERKKAAIEAKLEKLMNKDAKDDGVTFEELGVDHLTVDEAHLFKNLDYMSSHGNVKGIGVKGSQRAEDLYMKIRFLEQRRPGRSAIFATGTPLSRSMAEIYTMQRYLQPALLKEYDIEKFDTWASTFGRIVTNTEQDIQQKLKDVASFSKFINVPELQALYSRVADSVTANDLNLPRPALATGGPQVVVAEMSPQELDATKALIAQIAALKGPAIKGQDNHLSLFTKMLQVATDMRLQDPTAELNPNGKVAKLVDKVSKIYREGKRPALAQIIFLDMGVPTKPKKKKKDALDDIGDTSAIDGIRDKLKAEAGETADDAEFEDRNEDDSAVEELLAGKFNLYGDIIDRLVAAGIPRKEIATIYDANNDAQKAQLFKQVREGKIRILLGSSSKMGVGTNVQKYLKAMHHVDAPWNPADVVQRDGRILRQGNENKEVDIFRYVTELSADSYRWQILARKAEFEAQFRAGARGLREAEDIDSPLPEAATLRALATGDPRIMEHAELTKKIREIEAAKRGHERSTQMAKKNLADTEKAIAVLEDLQAKQVEDAPKVQDLKDKNFKVMLDTNSVQGDVVERKAAGEAVRSTILSDLKNHWGKGALRIDLGEISGFKMFGLGKRTDMGFQVHLGIEGAAQYLSAGGAKLITPESDPVGIMRQFEHMVSQVKPMLANTELTLKAKKADAERLAKQAVDKPFPKALELAEAKVRHEELERQLKPKEEEAKPQAPDIGDTSDIDNELSALVGDNFRTHEMPGYGTPEFEASRQMNVDGKPAVGYDAGVALLADKARAYAQGEVAKGRHMTLLLGPPGAGKSTIGKAIAPMLKAAYVTADDAKAALPEYDEGRNAQGVHPESTKLAERVVRELGSNGENTIWEMLGRSPAGLAAVLKQVRAAGYTVDIVTVSADPDTLKARIAERAKKETRDIDYAIVNDTLENLPKSLDMARKSGLVGGIAEIDNSGADPYIAGGKDVLGHDAEAHIQSSVRQQRLVRGSGGGISAAVREDDGRGPQGGNGDVSALAPEQANLAHFAKGENLDDGTPFVGDKEARYQEDMRAFRLRQAVLRELNDAQQNLTAGGGVGSDRQSGGLAEGAPEARAADGGSQGRNGIGERLESDRSLRAKALEAFLSPELKTDAITARALSQGFTTLGYHGTRTGDLETPNPFMPGRDFGFHVGLGSPDAANSRLGYASTLAEKISNFLSGVFGNPAPAVGQDRGSVLPLRLRVDKTLRLPDVVALGNGARWSDPVAFLGAVNHPQSEAPERLKRWVAQWITANGADVQGRRRQIAENHIFSRALADELTRLGYDAIVYKNMAEGFGKDSLFVWEPNRVRSAFDFFHDDAAGAEGLSASDDYVQQDLEARLASLMREEGIDDGQEAYTFDELSGLAKNLKSKRRLADPTYGAEYGRFTKEKLQNEIAWLKRRIEAGLDDPYRFGNGVGMQQRLHDLEALLPKFDEDLPRGKPFERSKDIDAGQYLVRKTTDERIVDRSNYGGEVLFSIYPKPEPEQDSSSKALGTPLGRVGLVRRDNGYEVAMVEVRPSARGKGVAKALYQAVQDDLGIEMKPSGILLPDGYAMWKKRNPDLVKYHREFNGGIDHYYISPKYAVHQRDAYMRNAENERERANRVLDDITSSPDEVRRAEMHLRDAMIFQKRADAYDAILDTVPEEGKSPEALNAMFALGEEGERGNLRLTPDAQAKLPAVKADVVRFLRQMLPADTAIRIADRLFSRQGDEQYARFRPDIKLVEVALAHGAENAFKYGAHEVVHVLRDAGAFTDSEWAALVARANKLQAEGEGLPDELVARYRDVYRMQAEKMGLPENLADRFVARRVEEEKVARLAETYFGEKKGRFGKTIDGLIERMKDILDAIVRGFNGQGLSNPAAVFRRMEKGIIKERVEPKPIPSKPAVASGPERADRRAVAALWPQAPAANAEGTTTRRFEMPGYDATVETRQKGDAFGLRTRLYSIAKNGQHVATMAVSEREPNTWEAIGVRLERQMQGKGIAKDLLSAVESDLGRSLSPDGMLPAERVQALQQLDPNRVAAHVQGAASVDGLYVPAASVTMMRDAATAAAHAGNDDAWRAAADFKRLEAKIPDAKFEGDRIVEEMAALKPRSMPPRHIQSLGDASRTDTDSPAVGLSDLVTMVNDALGTETRIGRLNPGLKSQMARLGAKLYGQFSRKSGLIRMAIPNDLPTLVHEGGHRLEIHPETAHGVEALQNAYASELMPLATPGANQLSEGWAEWFKSFLIDPATAQKLAPNVDRDFRNMMEANAPEMLLAFEAIQAGYGALVAASPAGVVAARVQSTTRPTTAIGERVAEVKEKGFVGAIGDWFYSAVKSIVDDKHPLKVARDFLLAEASRNLGKQLKKGEKFFFKAVNDPYKIGRMLEHSRVHAAARLKNGIVLKGHTLPVGPSFQDVLATAFGGSDKALWNEDMAQKFGAYLVSRRMNAEWDRYYLGYLDSPPDSLMTAKAWAGAQNAYEAAYPDFKKAAKMLDQFMQNALRWKYENGFLSDDQFQEYMSREGYAPLNRIMDDNKASSPSKNGTANKRKMIFQFKGSTRDFVNPIETIVADVFATEARVELNNLIGSLLKAAEAAGPNGGRIAERIPTHDIRASNLGDDLAERLKTESERLMQNAINQGLITPWDAHVLQNDLDVLFDATAGETIFRAVETNARGERIAYFWQNGKRLPVLLGSDQLGEDIYNILAGVGQPVMSEPWFNAAVLFSQGFRAAVTKNPAYIIVNWFRDQLSTWALSRDFTPFWTGLKGMGQVVKGGDPAKRYEAWAGMMGSIDAHIIDTTGRGRDPLKLRESGFMATTANSLLGRGWQKVLRATEISEAASRIGHMEAAYQRLIQDGYSEEEAAFEAAYTSHDVMDFSRRGSKMILASRLVAFLNSQLQGLSAALRTAKGERDTFVGVRDVISPYLKASDGIPLSAGEKEALPTSYKMWMRLASIGLIGLALALNYKDDPEYEELSKSSMGATHWFVKIGGVWWRLPKPFELAIFSNLFEAMFDRVAKNDPLATERFLRSVRETVLLNPTMQTFGAVQSLTHMFGTGPLDALTGKLQYDRSSDDLPQRLRGLPPELQWDAYTSEFSKMLSATFGISPYKTDEVIRAIGANTGRDLLSASDYVLPRINEALGGAIPGVAKHPRADKSFEDQVFISRVTRRTPRGAYSTWQFWQDMSADNGRFTTAAAGYKRLMDEQKSPRDAQRLLMSLDDERRAYVLLEYYYKEKDQDMHPLNRAKQVITAMNTMRRQMAEDTLVVEKENKRGIKGLNATKIEVAPSTQRVVNEILEDIAMREARNAQIALHKPGWDGMKEMPTDGLMQELRAAAPQVADELDYRLTHGRFKVYPFESVQKVWPELKQQLLTEEPGAPLATFRVRAKYGDAVLE